MKIREQTATLIGEAKHGLWRIQDNGHIREYRKYGKDGLRDNLDPNDPSLSPSNLEIINHHYTSYSPTDKTLYKYPNDTVKNGYLQYMDLSIYHPKYEGKYNDHEPIDLAHLYCILSGQDYPHLWRAWQYASMQPKMNKIGPLGKRAGEEQRTYSMVGFVQI